MIERHISHNQLRTMTAAKLREVRDVVHIVEIDKQPTVVLVSYELFLKMQDQLDTLWEQVSGPPQGKE